MRPDLAGIAETAVRSGYDEDKMFDRKGDQRE